MRPSCGFPAGGRRRQATGRADNARTTAHPLSNNHSHNNATTDANNNPSWPAAAAVIDPTTKSRTPNPKLNINNAPYTGNNPATSRFCHATNTTPNPKADRIATVSITNCRNTGSLSPAGSRNNATAQPHHVTPKSTRTTRQIAALTSRLAARLRHTGATPAMISSDRSGMSDTDVSLNAKVRLSSAALSKNDWHSAHSATWASTTSSGSGDGSPSNRADNAACTCWHSTTTTPNHWALSRTQP